MRPISTPVNMTDDFVGRWMSVESWQSTLKQVYHATQASPSWHSRFPGLKNYIATENIGITTSAGLVRNLFGRSIQLGRRYARSGNKAELYEALRLLGTGCHCLEDYSAHSNYTELALIELGERGVFPHVGRRTQLVLPQTRQSVYPIITGVRSDSGNLNLCG